uniref:Uncharacterized protein n=1 Tax=Moniliophthora roreri TaxID=221103 RepID=A0A0W0F8E3_MONRR
MARRAEIFSGVDSAVVEDIWYLRVPFTFDTSGITARIDQLKSKKVRRPNGFLPKEEQELAGLDTQLAHRNSLNFIRDVFEVDYFARSQEQGKAYALLEKRFALRGCTTESFDRAADPESIAFARNDTNFVENNQDWTGRKPDVINASLSRIEEVRKVRPYKDVATDLASYTPTEQYKWDDIHSCWVFQTTNSKQNAEQLDQIYNAGVGSYLSHENWVTLNAEIGQGSVPRPGSTVQQVERARENISQRGLEAIRDHGGRETARQRRVEHLVKAEEGQERLLP